MYASYISLLDTYIIFIYCLTVNKFIPVSVIKKHLSYWRLASEEPYGFTKFVHTYVIKILHQRTL